MRRDKSGRCCRLGYLSRACQLTETLKASTWSCPFLVASMPPSDEGGYQAINSQPSREDLRRTFSTQSGANETRLSGQCNDRRPQRCCQRAPSTNRAKWPSGSALRLAWCPSVFRRLPPTPTLAKARADIEGQALVVRSKRHV